MWFCASKVLENQMNFLGADGAFPSITRFIKNRALGLILSPMVWVEHDWYDPAREPGTCDLLSSQTKKEETFNNPESRVPLALLLSSLFQWDGMMLLSAS